MELARTYSSSQISISVHLCIHEYVFFEFLFHRNTSSSLRNCHSCIIHTPIDLLRTSLWSCVSDTNRTYEICCHQVQNTYFQMAYPARKYPSKTSFHTSQSKYLHIWRAHNFRYHYLKLVQIYYCFSRLAWPGSKQGLRSIIAYFSWG